MSHSAPQSKCRAPPALMKAQQFAESNIGSLALRGRLYLLQHNLPAATNSDFNLPSELPVTREETSGLVEHWNLLTFLLPYRSNDSHEVSGLCSREDFVSIAISIETSMFWGEPPQQTGSLNGLSGSNVSCRWRMRVPDLYARNLKNVRW